MKYKVTTMLNNVKFDPNTGFTYNQEFLSIHYPTGLVGDCATEDGQLASRQRRIKERRKKLREKYFGDNSH